MIKLYTDIKHRRFIFTGIFVTILSFNAKAQTDTTGTHHSQQLNADYNTIYRENLPTIFFGNEYGGAEKTLLVADINPNLVVFSTRKSRFFFLFSPRVQLRLLSAYKSPVRSPSYMPGGTLFTRVNNDPSHPKFLSLGYSHHSNGQEGPTLDPITNDFNRVDGKFTTNFYTLNYYFGKREVSATKFISISAFIGGEIHAGLFKTGYSKELTDKYGFIRTNGSWFYDVMNDKSGTADHYANHQRIRFDFTYILDKVYNYNITDAGKRLNASLKYYYQFGFMQNAAFTATAGYRGQDPYNIYFQDSYAYFAIGVAAGLSFDLNKKH
ncbi:MAG: hypothetical protein ABIP28_12980 [Mucilaginibacter sp.]